MYYFSWVNFQFFHSDRKVHNNPNITNKWENPSPHTVPYWVCPGKRSDLPIHWMIQSSSKLSQLLRNNSCICNPQVNPALLDPSWLLIARWKLLGNSKMQKVTKTIQISALPAEVINMEKHWQHNEQVTRATFQHKVKNNSLGMTLTPQKICSHYFSYFWNVFFPFHITQ